MANKEKSQVKKRATQTRIVMKRLMRNKLAIMGIVIILILIAACFLVEFVSPYKYDTMDVIARNQGPSAAHWFGTDELGRDILTRVLYGTRYSLSMGIASVFVGLVIGVVLGSIAGFFGGQVDNIIMRILDVIQAVPGMLMTIAISTALGTGVFNTILALALGRITQSARILRSQVLTTRTQEYVEAAQAIGCSNFRRIVKYILPNSFSAVLVNATMGVSITILMLASLSYIGLGVQPPTPEWGAMLSAARGSIREYPYQLFFPGLFIGITVLCLNLFGDGLRDALDPKLKD